MIDNLRRLKRRAADAIESRRGHSGSLLRGTAMLALAEMGNRVSRIVTAIVLARALTTIEFGMMALILTTYEFVRMLIHNGLGARIIQATEGEFDEVCGAVNRLNWIVGAIMCLVQMSVAWPVQAWFGADVAPMLILLGLVHVIYPISLVHACIAQREERFGFTASMLFFQITMDNVLTAAMAVAGWGVWAAVVPKVIVAITWVVVTRFRVRGWNATPVSRAKMWNVIGYARCVLAAESLNTFRANGDKLIVGKALGLEAFGIYSFAANTGSGIATGLATALGQAVLPYLSNGREQSDMRARFKASITAMSLVVMPIVLAQVALAPWYVPLVFGAKWTPAIPTLMLMCLGTLSRPLIVATSQLLRAIGEVNLEWRISVANAVLFVVAIIGGIPYGVEGVAACLAAISILPAIFFARMALAHADRSSKPARAGILAEATA